jgi:hypothetical protein
MTRSKKHLEIPHHTDHEGEPRTIDAIRARANLELEHVVTETMTLKQMDSEITKLCLGKFPDYIVILIEKNPNVKKYCSSIYIPKKYC